MSGARSTDIIMVVITSLLLIAGCAHNRYWVSRPVRLALEMHARQVPVDGCQARVRYPALQVTLQIREREDHFVRDFQLEVQHADLAIQAIARSSIIFDQQWETVELEMYTQYGKMTWRTLTSSFFVKLSREQMEALRTKDIIPGTAARLWHREFCTKDGPGSEGLDWPPDAMAPMERGRAK